MKRVGRSDAYASEFDLEADEYVPIPKGRYADGWVVISLLRIA